MWKAIIVRILVTGGAGRVGNTIVNRLVQQGYDVHVIDSKPDVVLEGATYAQCDIMDYDSVREQMRGIDKVVHLAAIPSPIPVPAHEVFRIDVAGTFNVFEAAAAEGIKRIAQASSINALGCAWNIKDMDLRYFPVDEEHPTSTNDVYSFAKQLVEDIGDYYWRREGISSVSFRLPAVWINDGTNFAARRERLAESQKLLDEFAALPEAERSARLADVRRLALEFRGQRYMEYPKALSPDKNLWDNGDWLWRVYAHERFNFWTYIDELDSAQAFDKALFADYEGHHALFVNAKNNFLNYDTNTLLNLFFPEVTARKRPIEGIMSPIGIETARQLIGFEPEYSI
jgi:dTDP-4-dehydrorhamnose reductase